MPPTSPPDPAALQRLLDRAAIEDCLRRYFRGIDRFDLELVRSAYHPGAFDDHGAFTGTVEEFVEHLRTTLASYDAFTHFHGNALVEFVDADHANVETYAMAFHRDESAQHQVAICVRYLDRFARRDGAWRVAHRRVVADWSAEGAMAAAAAHAAHFIRGRHDMRDPVYDWSAADAAPA